MIGRIIGVICCIIGIFILSLIVVTLILFTHLNSDEEKAYKLIDNIHTQTQENNYITQYFNSYIKYKMWRITKTREIKDYLLRKNKYKIKREAHFLNIKAYIEKPFKINEFFHNTIEIWYDNANKNKISLGLNCIKLCESIEPLVESAQNSLNHFKNSKKYSFKMFNLARLMLTLGNNIELQNINQIKGDGIVSAKNVNQYLKEFHVKFFDRKISKNRNKKIEFIDDYSDSIPPSDTSESVYSSFYDLSKSILDTFLQ